MFVFLWQKLTQLKDGSQEKWDGMTESMHRILDWDWPKRVQGSTGFQSLFYQAHSCVKSVITRKYINLDFIVPLVDPISVFYCGLTKEECRDGQYTFSSTVEKGQLL